jgi:DNA mismatch repair protein MutS
MSDATPMMQQYVSLKKKYADCILLFRLGDFYEMFGEDAKKAAPILDLTLTSRNQGKSGRIPMCGVPYHAVDGYITKLVENGFEVAICEQLEDPKKAKGLVQRDVIKIITPGTITSEQSLKPKENLYLAALAGKNLSYGLAACDLSTGEFICTQIDGPGAKESILCELAYYNPPEIIVDSTVLENEASEVFPNTLIHVDDCLNYIQAEFDVKEHFQIASLDSFGLSEAPLAKKAAVIVFQYLWQTQKVPLKHITSIKYYVPKGQMLLDAASRTNLELIRNLKNNTRQGTLIEVLDQCVTAMGSRLLKKRLERPLSLVQPIEERLDQIEALVKDSILRQQIREALSYVYDLERLLGRIATGSANGRDLAALSSSLKRLPEIKSLIGKVEALKPWTEELDTLSDLQSEISNTLVDDPPISVKEGNLIRTGYNQEVDSLRSAQHGGKSWIAALEKKERDTTSIKSLKVGFNKVFGYYIEVTRPNLALVPEYYIRKQTLANAERFITPELKEKEDLILNAEERLIELEYDLFCSLRESVAAQAARIQKTADIVAQIDVSGALAEVAVKNDYVRPKINSRDGIHIKQGRHPVVEISLEGRFIPNDVTLSAGELIILTGPNMAGKSTYLRQVAHIVLMAQIGSFVPAKEAEIGIVDRIFTRVGAYDDLYTGRSTFMVEMTESATICHNATKNSLVLIDELGRGTSTYDGMALAQAIAEFLHNQVGCKTIMSTHYHELVRLDESLERCKNYRVDVKEDRGRVVFLYQVVPGGADKSYGINVAKMAGLPSGVLTRAARILLQLERAKGNDTSQLSFFDLFLSQQETATKDDLTEEERNIIQMIREIQPDLTSPLEALNLLSSWHQAIKGED